MCCCCCCPPAITALFCLWFRSGFSKDSVAGALTFFPPEPPLYKFGRVNKDGEELPEESEDVELVRLDGELDDDDEDDDNMDEAEEDILDEDELGEVEISSRKDGSTDDNFRDSVKEGGALSGRQGNGDAAVAKKIASDEKNKHQKQTPKKKKKQNNNSNNSNKKSPTQILTERSKALRRRAKLRSARDARDAKNGVTYTFLPNPRLSNPPLYNAGVIKAVKIGPQPDTGTYLAALLYKLHPSRTTQNTKTILYSHGNATDIGAMNLTQSFLARHLNANVLVYDYSGYGASGGIPMEKNTYRDIKMVYEWTVKHVAVQNKEESIVVYGQSVGSGPSCYIAKKRQNLGGLILHSPFTSGMRVLTPSRLLACLDIFPNIDRIKHVSCPTLIIHGMLDEEVDIAHGKALYEALKDDCKREPWWVPDRGHNDIVDGSTHLEEYLRRLKRFLASLND